MNGMSWKEGQTPIKSLKRSPLKENGEDIDISQDVMITKTPPSINGNGNGDDFHHSDLYKDVSSAPVEESSETESSETTYQTQVKDFQKQSLTVSPSDDIKENVETDIIEEKAPPKQKWYQNEFVQELGMTFAKSMMSSMMQRKKKGPYTASYNPVQFGTSAYLQNPYGTPNSRSPLTKRKRMNGKRRKR